MTRGQEGRTVFTPLPGLEWMLRAVESEEEYQARVDAEWDRSGRPMTIETPSETIRPEHRVVLIKIARSAPADGDPAALLEATSKWWVVSDSRRGGGPASPEYALAVSRGRVVVAYRIDGWQRALDETVKRLKEEPLTHLMLGHRELFHSNLLSWFFECMPEIADAVFGPLTSASSRAPAVRDVRREKWNLDLWFTWPGRRPLVIENKVFSLPDEAQLASYGERADAGEDQPALWLLSLMDPSWPDDRKIIAGHEWQWRSGRARSKARRCPRRARPAHPGRRGT